MGTDSLRRPVLRALRERERNSTWSDGLNHLLLPRFRPSHRKAGKKGTGRGRRRAQGSPARGRPERDRYYPGKKVGQAIHPDRIAPVGPAVRTTRAPKDCVGPQSGPYGSHKVRLESLTYNGSP